MIWLVAILVIPVPASLSLAQTEDVKTDLFDDVAREVRTTYVEEFGVSDPRGVAVHPADGVVYILDSSSFEIVAVGAGNDVVGSIRLPELPDSDVAIAGDRVLYVKSNDLVSWSAVGSERKVVSKDLDLTDPYGVTYDPISGSAYILQAGTPRVIEVLESGATRRVSVDSLASKELDGVSYDQETDLLYLISLGEERLWGLNRSGRIVSTIDMGAVDLTGFEGMAFGPTADATDDPDSQSLYISFGSEPAKPLPEIEPISGTVSSDTDSSRNPGRISEVSLQSFEPATADEIATLINTTLVSNWDPPSPDPAGITYRSSDDRLIISDSEVNEMSIYEGINVYGSTRAGSLVFTGDTTTFSTEPTGMSFNSKSGSLYLSDDNSNTVTELDPGADGAVGTSDDSWTAISTATHGSDDSEGVAWDPISGDLFVIDGVNRQVYRISPGPDGAFDGNGETSVNWDVGADGTNDPEGIAYNPIADSIMVLDDATSAVYEYTRSGSLLRVIDVSAANAVAAAGVVLAPASDGSAEWHLYIVARGVDNGSDPSENDGVLYEMKAELGVPASAPDASDDFASTFENTPIKIDVLSNDSDPGGNLDPSSLAIASVPANGTAKVQSDNTISYTPIQAYTGTDSFSYRVCGSNGLCDTATVTLSISTGAPGNESPNVDAGPDMTLDFGESLTLRGLATDDGQPDPPGKLTFTWSKVSGPGVVTFGDSSKANTAARFSTEGLYVLRLTATDSLLDNADDMKVTVVASGSDNRFSDDDGHLFESDIEWLAAAEITKGCGPERFCPDDPVTRGEMAAFLVRALGYTTGSDGDLFVDDDHHLFESDIDKLGAAGVTRGCNPPRNDRFCPDRHVTRGQMAALLVRAMGYTNAGGGDLFVDDDTSIFEDDIDKLATAGVTKGCNPPVSNRFCPNRLVTRGQVAAFLHRVFG